MLTFVLPCGSEIAANRGLNLSRAKKGASVNFALEIHAGLCSAPREEIRRLLGEQNIAVELIRQTQQNLAQSRKGAKPIPTYGNKVRVIAAVHFNQGKVFVRQVLNHADWITPFG